MHALDLAGQGGAVQMAPRRRVGFAWRRPHPLVEAFDSDAVERRGVDVDAEDEGGGGAVEAGGPGRGPALVARPNSRSVPVRSGLTNTVLTWQRRSAPQSPQVNWRPRTRSCSA